MRWATAAYYTLLVLLMLGALTLLSIGAWMYVTEHQ